MKDQLITLMEAVRLANREFELHRQKHKSALDTLDAVETIFGDPEVVRAEAVLNLLASPSIAPK